VTGAGGPPACGGERSDSGNVSASQRLAELGIDLPAVVAPVAAYVPATRTGNLVYTSGQLPMVAGALPQAGKVGDTVSPEEAKALARTCGLNALAAVDSLVGIDSVTRVVKVVGFVASAPGFNGQPGVVNGASELFGEVFGDAGAHARSAVGVSELPLNAPVEVEIIVEVA
jgi:enamine deaminase RidA (YjgF/YER057c/UK114 family)